MQTPGRDWTWLPRSTLALTLAVSLFLSSAYAQYFVVNQPDASTSWANGSPYPFKWTKGLLDGIGSFDVELTRLSDDGLYYVAQNVPATYSGLNIVLEDVPPGDDYFLICLNSTHSIVYSLSSRFTVTTNSSSTPNPSPDTSAPTVTVSGVPNPLNTFAATLGPAANGAISLFGDSPNKGVLGLGGLLALSAAFLGGVMTLC